MSLFRLAERLGKTVGELMQTITAAEFRLWPLVDEIEAERRKRVR